MGSRSMLNYMKSDIIMQVDVRQPENRQKMLFEEKPPQNDMRALTSYAMDGKMGAMMGGKQGFIKRIAPATSKSALVDNKENQTQPKASQAM